MNIKDRLRLIEALPRTHGRPGRTRQAPITILDIDINSTLAGETIETPHGSFFQARRHYPDPSVHGSVTISSVLETDPSLLAILENNQDLSGLDLKKALFIDTETTGLSGGVGTCAFLIGVGYFSDSGFIVDQYFMNDFNEEMAMLKRLSDFVRDYSAIVTYNGKSFDIPLLNSRHIYLGLTSPFEKMHHIDLLHCVRRLWNHRLQDCMLTTAESQLVTALREGDVAGYLIPAIYFEFLSSRDPRPLKPVLYHNEKDIVAMVTLLGKACEILENPLPQCTRAEDILRVGKLYEHAAKPDTAIKLYESYLDVHTDDFGTQDLLFQLAYAHKKRDQRSKAARIWERCIQTQPYHPLPYIELAKHFEHRAKNFKKAVALVDKALAEIVVTEQVSGRQRWVEYRDELEYRKRRLLRKSDRREYRQQVKHAPSDSDDFS